MEHYRANRRVRDMRLKRYFSLTLVLLTFAGVSGGESKELLCLSPELFDMGAGCVRLPESLNGIRLRMNENYIARPKEGQEYEAWLAAMREYRRQVREGSVSQIIEMNFEGPRAWVRLSYPVTEAYALVPREKLYISVEARWLKGNNNLCFAFDIYQRLHDAKTGWSKVIATLAIPKDGQRHTVNGEVTVPQFDPAEKIYRPIFGMDVTHDPTPGKLEIRNIALGVADAGRMENAAKAAQNQMSQFGAIDRSLYDRSDLKWAQGMFALHFAFMYDSSFYNAETGEYKLDSFINDGIIEFGGYDAIILWQGYPRLGVDERNQFDYYRDMPGGLEGLAEIVKKFHEDGVKVFIDYNPWDISTRRESKPDDEVLAELVAAIDADGVFLDTMNATSPVLRSKMDRLRQGVALVPEIHPRIEQLGLVSASWAQYLTDAHPPGVLHLKWIEPRHIQNQIRRWELSHRQEIETAFFNGSGMTIWENIFGTYNPWSISERLMWRRAVPILRQFKANFTSEGWEPFYPTMIKKLCANCWPGEKGTVFTLLNYGEPIKNDTLLELPFGEGVEYYDLWNGVPLKTETAGENVQIIGSIDRLGCILAVEKAKVDDSIRELVEEQRQKARQKIPQDDFRNFARSVVYPKPVEKSKLCSSADRPAGMVFVPGTMFDMKVEHVRRECGCYPDPQTPYDKQQSDFLWGEAFYGKVSHDIGPVEVKGFFIDETEVSNSEFKEFLDSTGYKPKFAKNFLKHWGGGEMPAELAERPVVYVDIDDVRAYAKWAGKRLPTEVEWQLAAQGTDGRVWPWGDEFDPQRCNMTGNMTLPVKSLPNGRSPYGCYHMSGNVWEWTESCRDDGHTRFVMIRGGSYFNASEGSLWYVRGGPQPCNSHAKFIRMWPGLDRCSTIGFRCVVDAK